MERAKLYILFILLPVWSYSQHNDILIESDCDSLTFIEFVGLIEKEKGIQLYYRTNWVDTVLIRQSKIPQSLTNILDETFSIYKLNYYFDDNNLIITNDYRFNTNLPYYFEEYEIAKQPDEDSSFMDQSFLEEAFKHESVKQNGSVVIGNPAERFSGKEAIISGIVREEENGEPIIGCVVYSENTKEGTITDPNGYYVLTLPKGKHTILFKFIGRKDTRVNVVINESGTLDIDMRENIVQMRGVVITSEKEDNVKSLLVGMEKLDIQTIKQIPTSMGEADIIKTALLLPGVQSVGEAASGFNVRGGSHDQNLVLIDGSPIFNTSHLFGFFSVFNSEVIKDFRLYKSGIPAKFGGRVSSVFDVSTRGGNRKKYSVSGGISPITGKLNVEGPIINNKASFLIGGRSTYSNWILKRINRPEIKNSNAYFYDINARVGYDLDENNSITVSGYHSKDYFKLNSDTAYNYQNINASIIWKHSFSKKIYGTFAGIYSNYAYSITSDKNPYASFLLQFDIDYKALQADFSWFPNNKHSVNFGANLIKYKLNPGTYSPNHAESLIEKKEIDPEQAVETALYINDAINVTDRLSVNAGLRYSMFFSLGPAFVYEYPEDGPRTISTRIDSASYSANEIIKYYGGPELRLSTRYKTGLASSVKFGYNRIYQFLHMLSNTTAISPTDIWKLSDANIEPLIGDQVSVGFYKNLVNNTIETSVEVYYKKTKNQLDYKGGAELVMNDDIETDVIAGVGRAYGVEFMIRKKYGRWNGWISYGYSSSMIKVDSKFVEERINDGEYYPTNYDKPHDLKIITNYRFSRRFNFSNNFIYNTGRPITYPVAKYEFRDRELVHYTNRNEYRIPDYFRWDISVNIEGNLKSHKLAHSSWSFSVYNVTGRKNVYSIFFRSIPGKGVQGYKMSIFAQPIFTVTYNFKF